MSARGDKKPYARMGAKETGGSVMKSRAFTLIELLVVVLIIGILSAIALPKYQVAVAKAKFANLQSVARTYARAAEVVRLETGSWPRSFDVLAVDPGNGSSFSSANLADDACASNNEMYCCLLGDVSGEQYESVVCGTLDYSLAYFWEPQGKRNVCFAKANTYLDQVCKNLGGTENNAAGNHLIVPGGHRSGYNRYHF